MIVKESQAHHSLVVSMTTTWRCHRFESWLAYGDPSLGLPATLVEEIGLKIVVSSFFKVKKWKRQGFKNIILSLDKFTEFLFYFKSCQSNPRDCGGGSFLIADLSMSKHVY
jgi:hypothetical protein